MRADSDRAVIWTDRLACGHAGATVLADVALTLATGTITALIGPNGAGKSTLLKTLVGSLPALEGQVHVLGKPIVDYTPRDLARSIGYVPQEEEPQYAFTVLEAVIMGRLPHADSLFDSRDDIEAACSAMERVRCADLAERSILELSGGELQRVLLARGLAQNPSALLLDEPTAHLDVHYALELVTVLRGLAEEGLTIVAAIHDLNLAARLADDAVLLGSGRVQAHATVRSVLEGEALDHVFRVQFKRHELDGTLYLLPCPAST